MSADRIKTKQQLIDELCALRLKVAVLEKQADERDDLGAKLDPATQHLQDAITRIQSSVDNAPNPVFWVSADARFLYVNHAASRTLGYTRDELLSMSVPDIEPECPRNWEQYWARTQREKNRVFETVHRRKDGSRFPVELTINHVFFMGQECQWVLSRDISKRIQNEHTLQQALVQAKQNNIESKALFDVARTILEGRTFEENAQHAFAVAKTLIGSQAGAVIQLETDYQKQCFLFFEAGEDTAHDTRLSDVSPSVHQFFENVKNTQDPIFENHFKDRAWIQLGSNDRIDLKNLLLAPIEIAGQIVGLFGLANKPSDFDAHDAKLATRFAYLNAIALQHSRMDETITNQLRQRESLASLGQFALSAPNLQAIFDKAVETVSQVLEIEYTKILELMSGGEQLLLRAGVGWQDGLLGHATVGTGSDSQAGYTLRSENPVVVEDIRTEQRFHAPRLLTEHQVISGMSIGIGDGAQPFGVIGVHSRLPRRFTFDEIQFLETVAFLLEQSINAERTAQQLTESEARFRNLAQSSPVGIFLNDAQGLFQYINPSCTRLIGHGPEECIGRDVEAFIHPDDRENIRQKWAESIANESRFEMEYRWLHPDGKIVTTLGIATPIWQDDKSISCYVGTLVDLSERKRSELALQESEGYLRAILDAEPECVKVVAKNGTILSMNSAGLVIMEADSIEQIQGTNMSSLIAPEHMRTYKAYAQAVLGGEEKTQEFEIVSLRGTRRWLESHAVPMRNSEGEITAMLAVTRDITEKKHQLELIKTSEEQVRAFMDNLQIMAYIRDEDSRYIYVNPYAIRTFGAESWLGTTPSQHLPKALADETMADDRQTFAVGFTQKEYTALNIQGDGAQPRYYNAYKFLMKTQDGRPVIGGLTIDITEAKEEARQQELENACLKELNHPGDLHRCLQKVLALLQEHTGCEAVGIRLREGSDFPYFETAGFPEEFIEAERLLCEQGTQAIPILNGTGATTLECLCKSVLSGNVNTFLPFSTEFGSFWTNNRPNCLANLDKPGSPISLRNTCNRFGYLSQALIPLRSLGRTLGLIQFNDHHLGMFTPKQIRFLEDLSAMLAIAIDRKLQENERRRSRSLSKAIALASQQFLLTGDIQNMQKMIVEEAVYLTKAQYGILLGRSDAGNCHILAISDSVWGHPEIDSAFSEKLRQKMKHQGFIDLEMGDNLLTRSLYQGVPVLTNRPSTHPAWAGTQPPGHIQITSFLGMPIAHGAEVVGMVAVANRNGGFGGVEQEDLSELASSIAMAMKAIRNEEEKKIIEAQLQQSQKMEAIGRLAGGVAHDFNNMLSIISGYTEIAISELIPSDPLAQDLREIEKATKRAANLTRHLLAFARQQPFAPEPTDLNKSIDGCKNMLRRLIGEDIKLEFLPQNHLWNSYLDPNQFDQILVNFTVNARDAITGTGRIFIETNNVTIGSDYSENRPFVTQGDYVQICFSDDGSGIPADAVEHIFEPFFTTKEQGRGTGLGLATVYGIVKQSNGFITVYSEPGIGTTFKIYFPRFTAEIEKFEDRTNAISPTGSETILVTEDEFQILQFIKRVLEQFGYTVLTANSPDEACVLCEEHKNEINLLLTDIVMPTMNGQELRERLETIIPGIKTVFMSGYTADIINQRGILAQGVRFLQKPFDSHTLASRIREALDSRDFD